MPAGPAWRARCLAVSRGAAISGACAATFSTALTSLACAVMLASWMMSGEALSTLRASLRNPFGIALTAFLALAAIGMLYGSATWAERWHDLWGWRKLAFALLLLGLFAPEQWQQRFVAAFLVVAAIGVTISFLTVLGVVPPKSNQIAGTIQGVVLQNHSVQGMVFSLAILCAAHFARGATGRLPWVLGATALAFAINIIYVTPGRSGYVALAIATFVSVVMIWGWRRMHVSVLILVVSGLIAYATAPQFRDRITQAVNEVAHADQSAELTSMGARVVFYRTAVELILERPLVGYGTGSFGREYAKVVSGRYNDWRATPTTDPHNQYLFIAMQSGVVGLLAFCAILVTGFCAARLSPYGWIAGGALAIWCVTSLFSSHFRTFSEGHLIGLFLGALLAPRGNAASGQPPPQDK